MLCTYDYLSMLGVKLNHVSKRDPWYERHPSPARIILCLHPANERRRYIVTSSLIGWVHTQNDPCPCWCNNTPENFAIIELCNSLASLGSHWHILRSKIYTNGYHTIAFYVITYPFPNILAGKRQTWVVRFLTIWFDHHFRLISLKYVFEHFWLFWWLY